MAKALDFTDPDRMSMTVILTAMNRFINEADGSQTAFIDGNQPDRLCAPMTEHIEARGGKVVPPNPNPNPNPSPSPDPYPYPNPNPNPNPYHYPNPSPSPNPNPNPNPNPDPNPNPML